ncbi:MAG: lysophospholipid acyltransferase family protein [Bacillota bacterium]
MVTKKRFRHTVAFFILKPILRLYFRISYRFKAKRFKPPKDIKDKPWLVLGNHTTAHDPFFMGFGIPGVLYFVASDMLFSVKYLSRIMQYLVGPIPKTKYRSDMETIRDMKRIIDQGGSIGLFPEGNTTFSGEQMPIPYVIAKLIKKFKIPVLFYVVEGGYLARPRWSRKKRIGKVTGEVRKIWRPEDFKDLSTDTIYATIQEALKVDEFSGSLPFKSKQKAEDIESAYFVCPSCKQFETLVSKGDDVWCEHCDFHVRLDAYGHFENMGGTDYFDTTVPWYHFQEKILDAWLDQQDEKTILFENANERVLKVEKSKFKHFIGHADVRLYKTHIDFHFKDGTFETFDIKDVNSAVQQKNKLILHNFDMSKTYYLLSHPKRNALKYTLAIENLQNKKEID